jgi:BRCA1-associated protein
VGGGAGNFSWDAAPQRGGGEEEPLKSSRGGGGGSSSSSRASKASGLDALPSSSSSSFPSSSATSASSAPQGTPGALLSPSGQVSVSSAMEGIAFEYTLLLTSQLESQRMYFEGMLASLSALTCSPVPVEERKKAAEALLYRHHGIGSDGGDSLLTERESRALKNDLSAAKAACATAEARCSALESERRSALRRVGVLEERLKASEEEAAIYKAMGEAAAAEKAADAARLAEAKVREGKAAEEIAELRDQVRDLMLTMDVQARMAEEGAEAVEGTVISVTARPGGGSGGAGGGKGGKKGAPGKR